MAHTEFCMSKRAAKQNTHIHFVWQQTEYPHDYLHIHMRMYMPTNLCMCLPTYIPAFLPSYLPGIEGGHHNERLVYVINLMCLTRHMN